MENAGQITLLELLRYLRNFFPGEKWSFSASDIRGGRLALPGLENGDYYLIEGSRRNDGIHVYGEDDLKPESVGGTATELRIPAALLEALGEINAWQEKNAAVLESPYTSESFGGYSYTKAGGASGDGDGLSWRTVFGARLRQWRKL